MAGRTEFPDVLRELAQQQSARSQQQTALLQLQTESLRLQRLLIERAMGEAPTEEVPAVVTNDNADHVAPSPVESAQARGSIHIGTRVNERWMELRAGRPLPERPSRSRMRTEYETLRGIGKRQPVPV